MQMIPQIKLFVGDGEMSYVAPERSEICIKLNFGMGKESASISEPFLLRRGVERGCEWGDFFGHTMTLRLGRYVQASELAKLKDRIRPHVKTIRSGYHCVDEKTYAIFDNSALEGIDKLHRVVSAFSFHFEEPCNPDVAIAKIMLNMSESDLARLSRCPSSTLKQMAADYSKQC
ncbi:hypothetical protein ABWH88_09975 [Marinobacter adhaerens]|jgi:hypothetical protein|uniref:Uncharacterized protein n=1 Tax=Marinobacter adhaerens TaxID=1033846 RepID=A0ABX8IJ60_9GAMM|nr:hypothetical protein [Marinobacter adhaerens]QWV13882.1 hypothetical protein KQ249_04470 [Marinobacter adhaerens]